MIKIKFIHLRIYSEYSFKDGLIKLEDLIKKIKSEKYKSLAIADNNLFGLIDFYTICIKNKIKPIIGCNFFIKNNLNKNKSYKIILFVKNEIGYKNLLKLINKANLIESENNYYEIDKNWFKGELNKGLIIISCAEISDIGYFLLKNKNKKVIKKILFWSKYFKNRFYLELKKINKKNNFYNSKVIKISNLFNIPLVATCPVSFFKKKDFYIYKIKNCILNNNNINDNYLNKIDFLKRKNNFFIKKKNIIKIFKDIPSSLINTYKINKKCNLFINLDKIELPIFFNNKNNNKHIIKLNLNLLKKKNIKNIIYKKRILNECNIIIKMGLSDYFLIVSDFIIWSKKKKIPVGPGRGSSAGSLVSYLLNITDIDPIKNNLIFERFLNPKRVSMPDFDIDFCPIKRSNVINYIKKKYGIFSICQIVTFGKIASRSSIRDVGRVLNYNYIFIDKIAKLISFKESNDSIKNILKNNLYLKYRYDNENSVKKIINLVIKLENSIKNIGIHAGGVIISSIKIYNLFPLYIQNNNIITQYSKDNIEKIGILKFDFLGLKTLTIINKCIKNIKINYKININLLKLNLNNKLCFLNLKMGKTLGIFQLESIGMQKMLKKAKPNSFNNIIALISLYRPGPINLIEEFCCRKLGKKKITYFNKKLEIILKETYGIIIYQEQIMFIAKIISNFSLEEADLLRIAISKKNIKEMNNQKTIFIKNGIINGFNKFFLENLFDKIEKFAKYGFNKSHATAYALLSYQTIWLKTYFFFDFISTNMSFCLNNSNKLKYLITESLENNTFILPININKSLYNFIYYDKCKIGKIRYGFSSIKGIGENIINDLIKIRNKGLFKNFNDFYKRINKNIINRKIIETLICSGSFDSIDINRSNLIKNYRDNINNSQIKNKYIFFWKFKIKIIEEKLRIGFFFINNLYNIYKNKFILIIKNEKNINLFNNKYCNGIIIEIKKIFFLNNENYLLIINNNKNFFKIKINKILYNKNINKLKIFNFIIIFYIIKDNFYEAIKIYNMNNFE
ncbi:DNA polymerase III alpha subunit [Candidatus Nasuia deltocephalinicola]|nr:DNA polymerase III alpha subunit [Candidatus Nasuia deltocephalinicola]